MANYKRLFLNGHSCYITIVTHQRQPILVENIELLREAFRESKHYYHFTLDAITVLPDHLHMIITPKHSETYPEIIKSIKYNFTKRYQSSENIPQSMSRYRRKLRPVWQKRYYEHTIRNQKDWDEKVEYIKHNPVKHHLVERWNDWKYSSFS